MTLVLIIILKITIIIVIVIIIMMIGSIIIILRECAAEQRTSSWLQARVAKGLRAAQLRQFGRATARKADEFQDQA